MHHDIKQLRAKYKGIRCECSDPGCPVCHGNCGRLAFELINFDGAEFYYCQDCAQDAYNGATNIIDSRQVRVRLRPQYRNETTVRLLQAVHNGDDDAMPILADALEDAGYRDQSVLKRLRRKARAALQYLED